MTRARYKIPDLLRGLAALGVVAFHANAIGSDSLFLLVDLFFVLSGYVLARSFTGITTKQEFFRFMEKRLWRFLPLVWVALVVKLGIEIVQQVSNSTPELIPGVFDQISAALLLQILVPSSLMIIVPLWSLSAELAVNAVFSAFGSKLVRYLLPILAAGYALTLVGFWIDADFIEAHGSIRGLEAFGHGVMGIGLGVAISAAKPPVLKNFHLISSSLLTGLLLVVANNAFYVFAGSLVFAYFVWSLQNVEKKTTSQKFAAFTKRFGELSFGIYVWHGVLIGVLRVVVERLDLSEVARGIALAILTATASTVAAALSFKFVEKPAMERFKRRH